MSATRLAIQGDDEQYLPSRTIPNWENYYQQWVTNSRHARGQSEPRVLRYGNGAQEVIDIFEPSRTPRGTVVFFHGGYWSELGRSDFSYVAPELVKDKWRVAVVAYDLCPAVTLTQIVDQARRAVAVLAHDFADPLVVTGHSAGGQLAAMVCATDWTDHGVRPQIAAGIGLSGLYELDPLRATSVQESVRITDQEVERLSPARLHAVGSAPFWPVVGELEPRVFHAQAALLHEAWRETADDPIVLAGHNHFTVCDELARLVHEVTRQI